MKSFVHLLRKTLRVVIPLACGIALFVYLYADLDTARIFDLFRSGMHFEWVLLSMGIGLVSHVLRALRWQLQLNAMALRPPFGTLLNAIFGTYAVNLLFPRLGEVWRCGYVARREQFSFTKLFGSVVSDRLCDSLTVGLLSLVVFFWQMPLLFRFLEQYPDATRRIGGWLTSPWPYVILLVAALGTVWFFRRNRECRWVERVRQLMRNMVTGFLTVARMRHKGRFLFYTVAIWGCYYVQLYVCFFAFGFTSGLGALAALVVFTASSVSAALPVQGGIGPWHFAVMAALALYGVGSTEAGAFALVTHGAQLVLIVLLGIYTAVAIALERKQLSRLKGEPESLSRQDA